MATAKARIEGILEPNRNWDRLIEDYQRRGIALALGAGISFDSGLPVWRTLLERIAAQQTGCREQNGVPGLVDEMLQEGYSLPAIASVLEHRSADPKKFGETIRDALYQGFRYYRKSVSITRSPEFQEFLKDTNPTLCAVASLCARKNSQSGYSANPLVHAIANTNFDALLSEYAKVRFGRDILRTVDRPSAGAIQGRIDVYHVHGFFQFVKEYIGDPTKEAPDIRVLTEQEFFDFFNRPNSLFNYTFLYLLRKYRVLFIGMSLKDDNVRRLLHYTRSELMESYERERRGKVAERKSKRHYAILPRVSANKDAITESSLDRLGVRVLWVERFEEIPKRLANLYESKGLNWQDVY